MCFVLGENLLDSALSMQSWLSSNNLQIILDFEDEHWKWIKLPSSEP